MNHFQNKNGVLHAEDIPLSRIAEEIGTPVYVYSRATLERHAQVFADALKDIPRKHIAFAIKCNPNLGVLRVLTPLWLQNFMGYTATQAGIVTAWTGVTAFFVAPAVAQAAAASSNSNTASDSASTTVNRAVAAWVACRVESTTSTPLASSARASSLASGEVLFVTDNDGVNDSSGETQLVRLGRILN